MWDARAVSAEEAVGLVQSGMHVFVHGAAATPVPLLDALAARTDIRDVTLHHLHLEGHVAFATEACKGRLHSNSLFTGPALRAPVNEGWADFTPIFLSDIPLLFSRRAISLDAAIVQVSPPDKHGFCTLGTSVDTALAAVQNARIVIAEVNTRMPRTHGNTLIPVSRIDAFVRTDRPLPEHGRKPAGDVESRIGEHIAALVPDGATLQLGIGGIPDAVLARLDDKNDLGVHTEMFSDGIVALVEKGVITNRRKHVHRGRMATSFVLGSQRVFDFVDDNPFVEFYPCDHTNDTSVIRKNDNVVAVNSALAIDLSGQVVADSIGYRIYSGIGGQMDFIRGAALSKGGVPVIALPSTAAKGSVSRIVAAHTPGSGVVTSRGHIHWVATEYGAVNLWGKSLRQRAELLISIAHPDVRADLAREITGLRHFTL